MKKVCSSRDVAFDEQRFPGSPWYDVPELYSDSDLDVGGDDDDGEDEVFLCSSPGAAAVTWELCMRAAAPP
jgi:hypothetical protein